MAASCASLATTLSTLADLGELRNARSAATQPNAFGRVQATNRLLKAIAPSTADLPVRNELHSKVVFRDHLNVLSPLRNSECPLLIWCAERVALLVRTALYVNREDPVHLEWSRDEQEAIKEMAGSRCLRELSSFRAVQRAGSSDAPAMRGLTRLLQLVYELVFIGAEPLADVTEHSMPQQERADLEMPGA